LAVPTNLTPTKKTLFGIATFAKPNVTTVTVTGEFVVGHWVGGAIVAHWYTAISTREIENVLIFVRLNTNVTEVECARTSTRDSLVITTDQITTLNTYQLLPCISSSI
tara:strand:+ start:125 stop:448 length:324 start_codon:yes stop_codon:yes gene_type:complete